MKKVLFIGLAFVVSGALGLSLLGSGTKTTWTRLDYDQMLVTSGTSCDCTNIKVRSATYCKTGDDWLACLKEWNCPLGCYDDCSEKTGKKTSWLGVEQRGFLTTISCAQAGSTFKQRDCEGYFPWGCECTGEIWNTGYQCTGRSYTYWSTC